MLKLLGKYGLNSWHKFMWYKTFAQQSPHPAISNTKLGSVEPLGIKYRALQAKILSGVHFHLGYIDSSIGSFAKFWAHMDAFKSVIYFIPSELDLLPDIWKTQ